MLFDPFEEQFDLPATLVECAYGQCWQGVIIGEKQQRFAGLRVFETNASQMIRKVSAAVETIEYDSRIADCEKTSEINMFSYVNCYYFLLFCFWRREGYFSITRTRRGLHWR